MKISAVVSVLILLPLLQACDKRSETVELRESGAPGVFETLKSDGTDLKMSDGVIFRLEFDRKPSLGTIVAAVKAEDPEGLAFTGFYGMPSMPYHDSGPVRFQLNKKGYYVMPLDIVMPGEWEFSIKAERGGQTVYEGSITFTI